MGTLLNFGVGPVAGGLMDPDALGRKPFLVLVSEFQSFRVLKLHFFLRRVTLTTPVKQCNMSHSKFIKFIKWAMAGLF